MPTGRPRTVPIPPDDGVAISCLVCGKLMGLHQLDAELPDRLVGACPTCKTWALVELLPGGREARVALLPDGVSPPDGPGA